MRNDAIPAIWSSAEVDHVSAHSILSISFGDPGRTVGSMRWHHSLKHFVVGVGLVSVLLIHHGQHSLEVTAFGDTALVGIIGHRLDQGTGLTGMFSETCDSGESFIGFGQRVESTLVYLECCRRKSCLVFWHCLWHLESAHPTIYPEL